MYVSYPYTGTVAVQCGGCSGYSSGLFSAVEQQYAGTRCCRIAVYW